MDEPECASKHGATCLWALLPEGRPPDLLRLLKTAGQLAVLGAVVHTLAARLTDRGLYYTQIVL